MAQSTVRLAAGAGVLAASLLILGPFPAEAGADKHSPGSHNGNDDRGNRSTKPGGGPQGPGRNLLNSIRDGLNVIVDPKPSIEPPKMDLAASGSNFGDHGVPMTVESFAVSESPVAMRSATVGDLPTVNAVGAVPRSGSDPAGPPVAAIRTPRVVIGNGRTPAVQNPAAEAIRETLRETSLDTPVVLEAAPVVPEAAPAVPEAAPVAPEAAPAVPAAIEITIPPPPPPLPPVERMVPTRLVVGESGTAKIDTVADPLAGLVGLILIPAVGAALGYRHARAAQALRESART